MTATTKKPRAARRRKPTPIVIEAKQTDDKVTPLNGSKVAELEKVSPTSTKQLPVVITPEPRTLFEYALLPVLYLEEFIKLLLKRLSPSA